VDGFECKINAKHLLSGDYKKTPIVKKWLKYRTAENCKKRHFIGVFRFFVA